MTDRASASEVLTPAEPRRPVTEIADSMPDGGRPSGEWGGRARSLVKHALLILAGFAMIYPLLWMVASSFKPDALIFREPGLIPSQTTAENYGRGWTALLNPFSHYLMNSFILVAGSVIGNLVSTSLAAYAFARLNFRLRGLWFGIMLM